MAFDPVARIPLGRTGLSVTRLGFVGIIGHHDIGMAQGGDRFHLPLKPFDEEGVRGKVRRPRDVNARSS